MKVLIDNGHGAATPGKCPSLSVRADMLSARLSIRICNPVKTASV